MFKAVAPKGKRQVMKATPATADVRPVALCAILRDVTFTPESYKSFIDLQVRKRGGERKKERGNKKKKKKKRHHIS